MTASSDNMNPSISIATLNGVDTNRIRLPHIPLTVVGEPEGKMWSQEEDTPTIPVGRGVFQHPRS